MNCELHSVVTIIKNKYYPIEFRIANVRKITQNPLPFYEGLSAVLVADWWA